MKNLVNFLFFQVVWFAVVGTAAKEQAWMGLLGLALWLCVHGLSFARPREGWLLVIALVVGVVVDSSLATAGLLQHMESLSWNDWVIVPVWIAGLWLAFGMLLCHSLAWLSGRHMLAAALGAIGGPLSFLAGSRLGAVSVAEGAWPWVALAVEWALLTPLLLWLSRWLVEPE